MNDRSVEARDIRNSVVVAGDGNSVRLMFGDSGAVLPLRRLQCRPPARHPRPDPGRRRELDILRFDAGSLPFIGRDDQLATLQAWLRHEVDVSVYALTGRAGTGKTRLALELCAAIDPDADGEGAWLAGFISPSDLPALVDTLATRDFRWRRQTLLVLDYAAQCHKPLSRWLDRLAARTLDTKLRFLLLECGAPEAFGWWHELTNPGLHSERARLDLFATLRPTHLPDLAALEERRRLLAASLHAARKLRPEVPPAGDIPLRDADPAFDARLALPQFGNPLSLAMAGVIALDRGPHAALALHRLDAARDLGRRELRRLISMAGHDPADADAMRHLVAFNGLAGGLPIADLRRIVADELAACQRPARLDGLLSILEQELPPRVDAEESVQSPRLATIQPDLIGEAAIIEAFTGPPAQQEEAHSVVRRAYALAKESAAQALVSLVQDYGYALEDQAATNGEKVTGQIVVGWLLTLADSITEPEQLVPLVLTLPLETLVLREFAAAVTQRTANIFKRQLKRYLNETELDRAAGWLNNLSVRLGALGRFEEALEAASEAALLYRALAEAQPDTFTRGLAMSLNNLAHTLSALGRKEAALAAAEEAVERYRALAEVCPDAITPDLAGSLNNLAIGLGVLGRHTAALAAAAEALELYRALAEAHPDAFVPNLSMSLDNYANRLSALGRHKAALGAAEEAVQLYRALAERRPDAFASERARSLNNIASKLVKSGQHEAGLAAADEAVQLYRALAGAHPDAFTPDLASSLNTFATILSRFGRHETALAAANEAVQLSRALANARPDALTPDLAASLIVLANRLGASGRHGAALAPAVEATQLFRAVATASPDAFTLELARSLGVLGLLYAEVGRPEALSVLRVHSESHAQRPRRRSRMTAEAA